jgi:hypothetical protein
MLIPLRWLFYQDAEAETVDLPDVSARLEFVGNAAALEKIGPRAVLARSGLTAHLEEVS